MLRWAGWLIVVIWGAVLLGGAFRPQLPPAGGEPRPAVGYFAPEIKGKRLDGTAVALSDLRGKAVMINFWASWCGPCRLEMPEIVRLQEQLPEGTAILSVNVTDQEQDSADVRRFLQAHGYAIPVMLDPHGDTGRDYAVISLPTNLFVDRDGRVVARINGPLPFAAMLNYLQEARGR